MAARPRPRGTRERGTKERRPGFVDDGPKQRDGGQQVAGHDAQRKVGEPGAGEGKGERRGGAREGAADGWGSRIAIAQRKEDDEREPEASGEFGECGALIGGEQREAGKDGDAAGQSGGCVVERVISERLKGEGASGPSGSGQDEEGERDGREMPGKNGSQRRAQHPRERRVKDETRLAGAVVGAGRPMRIRDAVTPGIQAVEPGDEVHVEVVAAGVAAKELRDNGDEGGEED